MSEPVGNSPRRPDEISGNAHKNREVAPKKEEEPREPVEKIIEGKVVQIKQPWWKRATKSIIADDAKSIGDFMLTDLLLPAIRNMIRDVAVGGVDRALYGTAKARRDVAGTPQSFKTRYDQMADAGQPRKMLSRESRARHDFNEIVLDNRLEAVEVVESLAARVARYGSASVADLYDLVGVTGSYADRNHGWSDLRDADVRQHRGGWLLDLPQPQPLR